MNPTQARAHGPPPLKRLGRRGSAVITVLVLAAVTAVIATGFLFRSSQEARLANRSYYVAAALNLAEAAVEECLHAANSKTINGANGWNLVSGSTTDYHKTVTSAFNFPQATGSIYMRIDNALSSTPTVIAAGVISIPNQPKIVKQLRVGTSGPARIWGNGIVAKGNVTFSGSTDIDSYDSNVGAWNSATNRSDRATVATNATVQVSGSAQIYGYVATGGTAPSVGGSGRIYGAASPGTPLVDPSRVRTDFNANLGDATAPTSGAISLGASYGSGTLPRAGDTPGPNGRYLYTMTDLSIGGSNTVTIAGPVDIVATGNVTVGGSGRIAISGNTTLNPSLNLYSPGTISIGGSGMINGTAKPINASIWGTRASPGTQTVDIGGSGAFYGTVYAPNAAITISGSGGLNGAIIGKTVTLSGSGVVHYDVQLLTATSSGGPNPASGSGNGYYRINAWSELTDKPGSGTSFVRDNRTPFAALF